MEKSSDNNSSLKENNMLCSKVKRNQKPKHISKKKQLLQQLEFYFSDENLMNDKYLRNLLNKDIDKGVEISILESFNKIKDILEGEKDKTLRKSYIKSAVNSSKKIKLNPLQNKIIRIENFDETKINQEDLDNRTIYVDNLPSTISQETLKQLFSRCGKVLHISIPKFPQSKKSKGFAFVIFSKKEETLDAIAKLNHLIPKEMLTWGGNESVKQLIILSKKDWTSKKEEFKKLKKELQNENMDIFAECLGQDAKTLNTLTKGTLVKLANLPDKIDKFDIKIWVSHFIEPAYVDYDNNECIIRFSNPLLADSFTNKIETDEEFTFHDKKVLASKMEGDEEDSYFKKVEELKREFKKNSSKKKKSNKGKKRTLDDNVIMK